MGESSGGESAAARDAAWRAVHDPATPAERLFAIAQAYPEFGEAIARHPHCYPQLREWIAAYAAAASTAAAPAATTAAPATATPASTVAPARASSAPTRTPRGGRVWLIVAASVVGLALMGGGAAWALTALNAPPTDAGAAPSPGAVASPTPTFGDRVLAGAPVYTGDELSWLLLDAAEAAAFFPDAASAEAGSTVFTVGESEGAHTEPAECFDWIMRNEWPVVGTRSLSWSSPALGEYAGGWMYARQFPDGDYAAEEFARFAAAGGACASFEVRGADETVYGQHALTVTAQNDAGLVVEHRSEDDWSGAGVQTRAVLVEGNVIVTLDVDHAEGDEVDGAALLTALQERAAQARQNLTEEIGYR